ncbi:MAG TPA: hypothetical protein VNB86_09655 [Gaiellaceae bacterium]|nr:hypothetical protein [Gaiellaceae bacterium]
MADTKTRATTNRSGVAKSVRGTASAVGEKTTGAVGSLVGILTGGLVIAAAGGFAVGVAVGAVAGRLSTPQPPRWQVWR